MSNFIAVLDSAIHTLHHFLQFLHPSVHGMILGWFEIKLLMALNVYPIISLAVIVLNATVDRVKVNLNF